jgi:hypothetical protein
MDFNAILQTLAPWLTQGVGGAAFALVWTIRVQFKNIKAEQKKNSILLRRLIALHCQRYPKESFALLDQEGLSVEMTIE